MVRNPINPFQISFSDGTLTIGASQTLRELDWGAFFGRIQKSLKNKKWEDSSIRAVIIDFTECQWADPLPLLYLMLSIKEFFGTGSVVKTIIPSPITGSKRFLKFIAQEGFLGLIFNSSNSVEDNAGQLENKIIEDYCSLSADLAYINSKIGPAEIIDCNSVEVVDRWVEEKTDKASGILEGRVPMWAFEDLMYRLKTFLIETLHNVSAHAYNNGQPKYAAVYIRFREGLTGVNPAQFDKLEQSLLDEDTNCLGLKREYLSDRECCMESFVADSGVGLRTTLGNTLRTTSGKRPKRPFSFGCLKIFNEGLRRPDRETSTSTGGLCLLARLINRDFLRGIEEKEWVGTVLPLERVDANNSGIIDCIESCGESVKGLSWTARLSWQSPTDIAQYGWQQHNKGIQDHPIFVQSGSSRRKWLERAMSWFVDDRRFRDLEPRPEQDNISEMAAQQDFYLLLPKPGLAKNDITKCIEVIANKIPANRQINLIIADIPSHEAITYSSALNNFRVTPSTKYLLWPSRFNKITLLSQGMSAFVLNHDNSINGFRHNKEKSRRLLEQSADAEFDPGSNVHHLFYWLKLHDTGIFWTHIRASLNSAFVNGDVIWSGELHEKKMTGYLDFAQTLSDLFCRRLYWMALLRISGLSSYNKYRLFPIDGFVKSLVAQYNATVLPTIRVQEKNRLYVGSVKVSGLTEQEAILRVEGDLAPSTLHFFCHPSGDDSAKSPSLFFWPQAEWLKRNFPIKSGYKRVGQSSMIALGGSKYFVIPRYDNNDRPSYQRSPKDSYKDWQGRNPLLIKTGHWEYQSHHDLLTINIWNALKYSFAAYGSLASFLMSVFFQALGIKNDEGLTSEGGKWLKGETKQIKGLPKVCAIVYPSHSTTQLVIENLSKAIQPQYRKSVVAVHPIRKSNSGSPALVSPLTLEVVSRLINDDPSKNILFFDDALISGRTSTELESLLLNLGAKNVYKLCIIERRRLPGTRLDSNRNEVLYWRLDVPALGDGSTCIICKALSIAQDFSHNLISEVAQNHIKRWVSDWQIGHPITDWWEKGLTPVGLSLKNSEKKYGIKKSPEGSYEQIGGSSEKISLHSSTGLSILASELHAMTSHDSYALDLIHEESDLNDMAVVELISSQLILFHDEFSLSTLSKLLKSLLTAANRIETTNKYTSLAALVCLIQNSSILSKVITDLFGDESFADTILNEDLLVVLAYAIYKDSDLYERIKDEFNAIRSHRLLQPDKKDICTIYDRIHLEIYNEFGQIHSNPLSRFGRDATYEVTGKSTGSKIWDATSNISILKFHIDEIHPDRIRADTPYESKLAIMSSLENALNSLTELKEKGDRTDNEMVPQKENVKKLIQSLEQFHSFLFYDFKPDIMNTCNNYRFEEDELMKLVSDVDLDRWKKYAEYKKVRRPWDDLPKLLRSSSGDSLPSLGRKNVWVVWDNKVKQIVKDLVFNVVYAKKEMEDPWKNNVGTADMWILVEYYDDHLTITMANASESSPEDAVNKARRDGRWAPLEEIGGSVFCRYDTQEGCRILKTTVEVPYAGHCLMFKKNKTERLEDKKGGRDA